MLLSELIKSGRAIPTAVVARERRAIQYSRASVVKWKGCGVLDAPLSAGHDNLARGDFQTQSQMVECGQYAVRAAWPDSQRETSASRFQPPARYAPPKAPARPEK